MNNAPFSYSSFTPTKSTHQPNKTQSNELNEIKELKAQIGELKEQLKHEKEEFLKIEQLCDSTYVASGADAYHYACDILEDNQKQREEDGKDPGAKGSLCDGISWLYSYINELETQIEYLAKNQQDVKRYEYIRKQHWDNSNFAVVYDPKNNVKLGSFCPSGVLLDDLIDADIKQQENHE